MNVASQNVREESHRAVMSSLPELSDEQFFQWVSLINDRTGIYFPIERKSFLTTNIRLRIQTAGFSDYESYYELVTSGPRGLAEWVTLLDHLTVQETCFNRHTASYDAIREYCRQYMRSIKNDQSISLQVLSMGCATGEEAYTLAIAIDDVLSQSEHNYYFGVTAADISSAALATAREAVYGKRRLEKLDQALKNKYFTKLDDGVFQVNESLRQHVCFSRLNIMELDKAPLEGMDIIMCQNLLIYFKRERRLAILEHLVKHLRPGGLLVLGPGEILNWNNPLMQSVNFPSTLAFRRNKEQGDEQGGRA